MPTMVRQTNTKIVENEEIGNLRFIGGLSLSGQTIKVKMSAFQNQKE